MTFDDLFTIDLDLPANVIVVWAVVLLGQFILSVVFSKPSQKFSRRDLIWLAVLSALMVFTSIFAGIDLETGEFFFSPITAQSSHSITMLFSAIPWMLAAFLLNPFHTFILALASGFLNAMLFTHSIFTPLYYAAAGLIFTRLIRIDLSIKPNKAVNAPITKTLLTIIMLVPIAALTNLFLTNGLEMDQLMAKGRLIDAFQISLYLKVLLGGIIVQISALVLKKHWQALRDGSLQISTAGRVLLHTWVTLSVTAVTDLWLWQFLTAELAQPKVWVVIALNSLVVLIAAVFVWFFVIRAGWVNQKLINRSKQMINGNFNEVYQAKTMARRSTTLERSIDDLRKTIKIEKEVQQRLISLDPALPETMNLDNVLSLILRSAYDQTVSSVRIFLYNQEELGNQGSSFIRMGLGTHNKLYAYLDELIAARLKLDRSLYLSDLKVNQVMDIKEGMPFPPALIALRLEKDGANLGVLWLGFTENRWYDEADRIFYNKIANRAVNMISSVMQVNQVKTEVAQYAAILDKFPQPVFLLDAKYKVKYANSAGKSLDQSTLAGFIQREFSLEPDENGNFRHLANGLGSNILTATNKKLSKSVLIKSDADDGADNYLLVLRDGPFDNPSSPEKSEFITTLSHALRMPLNRMKGYTALLENIGSLSDQQIIYLQRIFSEMDGMQKLIDNILNMERLEANSPLQVSGLAVKDLVQSVVDTVTLQAVKKKVNINLTMNGLDELKINADQTLVHQALLNILDNGIRYSKLGGDVNFQVKREGDRIQFIFEDNGPGIAPLDVPRLFDKYFHVESGQTSAGKGVGLGLAIVRSVAERHGGEVRVTTQLGRGSTFCFEIPLDASA